MLFVLAGCEGTKSWWDTQFGPKQDAPKQEAAQPAPNAKQQQTPPRQQRSAPQQTPQPRNDMRQNSQYAGNTPTQSTPTQRSGQQVEPMQLQGAQQPATASPQHQQPTQSNYQVASNEEETPEQLEERIRRYVHEFPNSDQNGGATATPSNTNSGAEPMNMNGSNSPSNNSMSSGSTAGNTNASSGANDVTWYEPADNSSASPSNVTPASSNTNTMSTPSTSTPQQSQTYTPPASSSADNTPRFENATMARPQGGSSTNSTPPTNTAQTAAPTQQPRPSPPPIHPDTPAQPTHTSSMDSSTSSAAKPPVLTNVTTTPKEPDPAPIEPARAAPPSTPRTNESTRLASANPTNGSGSTGGGETIDGRIRATEQKVAANPNDVESQIELRMLYLAAGQDAKAAEPIEGVSKEMSDMVAGLMGVLRKSRDAAGDPDAHADELLDSITKYRNQIAEYADLRVPVVALCTEAMSYGAYKAYPPSQLVAKGQPTSVIVYCEVENFSSHQSADGIFHTRLSWQVLVLNEDGDTVATLSQKDFEDVSRNRRRDFFLADVVQLPANLSAGDYVLRVMIDDRGSGRFSTGQTRFTMLSANG